MTEKISTTNVAFNTADTNNVAWLVGTTTEARDAAAAETSMTLRQALKQYPKAIFWSCVISLVVIMDGYDTALIGSFYGYPAFQQRFGIEVGNTGTYQVQAKWQTALSLSGNLGSIIGIFANGVATERWGHKKVLLAAISWLTGCIFIVFFSPSIGVLLVGEILCGLAWGVFTTMGPAYASEVTPVALRAYLETFVVLCWGIGQFIASAILDGLNTHNSQWAWRIPFAVQWVWPVIIIPLVLFCPESPWWLVRKNRLEEAESNLMRLSSVDSASAKAAIALMVETTELEKALDEGNSYIECFRGDNLWRTEISCVIWSSQVLVGFAISSYATYFYEQAGLSAANAYKMALGQSGLHLVCTLLSVFITARHGRRNIFIYSSTFMGCMMLIIGFIALAKQTVATGYASSAVYLVWFSAYELGVGPIVYVVVGEVSSTRLRSKTIALGRNAYNLVNIISSVVAPYCLNPTEGNWKGKTAFLAGGFCMLSAIWGIFRLPECKGRTYEEIDILFFKKLKAWQFKGYQIDSETLIGDKVTGEVEHREHRK